MAHYASAFVSHSPSMPYETVRCHLFHVKVAPGDQSVARSSKPRINEGL
jgi:hypothetical protein